MATDHFRQVRSFSTVSDEGPRQESLASRRGSHSSAERCCRISEPSSYSRFLFPPFSCTKEKWENETCDKPLRPESASNSAAFQDGDQQIYQGFNSFRYVDNVSRFDRRLFPYSYFLQVPQVPEICLGRQGIRFQDDAFGLSTTPLVFTRMFQAVVAHLHNQSIFIHSYLDDSLL